MPNSKKSAIFALAKSETTPKWLIFVCKYLKISHNEKVFVFEC